MLHLRTVGCRGEEVLGVELLHLLHLPAGQLDQAAAGEVGRVGVGGAEKVSPTNSQPRSTLGCVTIHTRSWCFS